MPRVEHPVGAGRAQEIPLRCGVGVAGRDDQILSTGAGIGPGGADVGDRPLPGVVDQALQVWGGVDHGWAVGGQVEPGEGVADVRVRGDRQGFRADSPPTGHRRRAAAETVLTGQPHRLQRHRGHSPVVELYRPLKPDLIAHCRGRLRCRVSALERRVHQIRPPLIHHLGPALSLLSRDIRPAPAVRRARGRRLS